MSLEKTLKTLKKALKPTHTRSQTEVLTITEECPDANVNLASVGTAEPVWKRGITRSWKRGSSGEQVSRTTWKKTKLKPKIFLQLMNGNLLAFLVNCSNLFT